MLPSIAHAPHADQITFEIIWRYHTVNPVQYSGKELNAEPCRTAPQYDKENARSLIACIPTVLDCRVRVRVVKQVLLHKLVDVSGGKLQVIKETSCRVHDESHLASLTLSSSQCGAVCFTSSSKYRTHRHSLSSLSLVTFEAWLGSNLSLYEYAPDSSTISIAF